MAATIRKCVKSSIIAITFPIVPIADNLPVAMENERKRETIQVGAPNWHNHQVVTVQECSILAHLGLRSIRVLFEKAQMGQDGVLLNSYAEEKNK